ncbi:MULTISPECIES: hypothetical protein [unclassified Sphingomonas]|uniref:hypothetical protein n=1 Tax=unclassified Sphingomonas TaxID=196159 RepID=UPI0004DB8379|nr:MULTISPECIES: hypothetical protein [unclassified Sphingomonas]MBD8641805.1 hypothetical protein [Sphingomonas sp. CFBP 13733]MBD8702089.1 hypothetical protein [Sphingomonas sp. CFBP 13714]
MNTAAKLIAAGLVATGMFALGYDIGGRDAMAAERSLVDWNGSAKQSQDAVKRWAAKIHETQSTVNSLWYARNFAFPNKNCVQLVLKGGVGGEPIYCYRFNSFTPIEEYSDVE